MKKVLMLVMSLLVLALSAPTVRAEVVPDKVLKWGDDGFKEFSDAWKASKEARAKGDFVEAADLAPYSWVKAWDLYNAAGKAMNGSANENGDWDFSVAAPESVKKQVVTLLSNSEDFLNKAVAVGLVPSEKNKNSMARLQLLIDHAEKMLGEDKGE